MRYNQTYHGLNGMYCDTEFTDPYFNQFTQQYWVDEIMETDVGEEDNGILWLNYNGSREGFIIYVDREIVHSWFSSCYSFLMTVRRLIPKRERALEKVRSSYSDNLLIFHMLKSQ